MLLNNQQITEESKGNKASQKTIKISNKQPNLTLKATRERTKPRVSRKKEIIKKRVEINETQKKIIQKIHDSKIWFFEKIKKLINL